MLGTKTENSFSSDVPSLIANLNQLQSCKGIKLPCDWHANFSLLRAVLLWSRLQNLWLKNITTITTIYYYSKLSPPIPNPCVSPVQDLVPRGQHGVDGAKGVCVTTKDKDGAYVLETNNKRNRDLAIGTKNHEMLVSDA